MKQDVLDDSKIFDEKLFEYLKLQFEIQAEGSCILVNTSNFNL